jgi:hypothetical protein
VIATGALSLFGAPAALANGTNGGAANVTAPDHVTPLTSGAQNTAFSFQLPNNAHCTQDTATGGFHIFGYVVQQATDPSTLFFNSTGPHTVPSGGLAFPLVTTVGQAYSNANTDIGTGGISNIPSFDWVKFTTTRLPPGSYNIGVACATPATDPTVSNEDVFFNAVITMDGSLNWTVQPGTQVPESPFTVALPLSAVAVLALGGVVVFRRRRRSEESSAATA